MALVTVAYAVSPLDLIPDVIPVLGYLFKSKGVFKRHDELLIFITPRIVKY